MKKSMWLIPLIISILWSSSTLSINAEQMEHEESLSLLAKLNCSSEKIEGKDYKVSVLSDGNIEVSFFGKKGGGINGTFKYTQSEWKGRQRVLKEHQAIESKDYRSCKKDELKFLRKSYASPRNHVKNEHLGTYSIDISERQTIVLDTKNRHQVITIESDDETKNKSYRATDGYTIKSGSLVSSITYQRKGSRVDSSSSISGNSIVAKLHVRDSAKLFSGRGKATFDIRWVEEKKGTVLKNKNLITNKVLLCGESSSYPLSNNIALYKLTLVKSSGEQVSYSGNYSNELYKIFHNKKNNLLTIESCY